MDLVVYDDDERRYLPEKVAAAAVGLTAVLAVGLTFLLTGSSEAGDDLSGVGAPQAATASQEPAPSPAADEPEAVVTLSPTAEPSPAAPAVGPSRPPACAAALLQADAALQRSTAIEQALAEQTRIMDELLAQRITAEQALDQSLPVLTRGAGHRDFFQDELAAYQQSREACPD